jgi:hypothetical protein
MKSSILLYSLLFLFAKAAKSQDFSATEYEMYPRLLHQFYNKKLGLDIKKFVISGNTVIFKNDTDLAVQNFLHTLSGEFSPDLYSQLLQMNRNPVSIRNEFIINDIEIVLLDEECSLYYREVQDAYRLFRKDFPYSSGIISVSVPAYDQQLRNVLAYLVMERADFEGFAYLVHFRKFLKKYRVKKSKLIWVY